MRQLEMQSLPIYWKVSHCTVSHRKAFLDSVFRPSKGLIGTAKAMSESKFGRTRGVRDAWRVG